MTVVSTDTPTLGISTFMLPSAANVKYCLFSFENDFRAHKMSQAFPSPGNYTKPIKSMIKRLDMDNMKQFLSKFSR